MSHNTPARVLFASLVGTTIEYYDFYLYGTAAALVFGALFFPGESTLAQQLASFASFAIAFIARPLGSAVFGHFGDRFGRKSTLVASLMIMGVSTTLIGLLPGFASIGVAAPVLLCLLRFAQGLGLGGEWGGAALVATENAPAHKRGWFGIFPQLGAPLGFMLANGLFLLMVAWMGEQAFRDTGWRIPFLLSAVLLVVGLYVRLTIEESPAFKQLQDTNAIHRMPMLATLRLHGREVLLGALAMMVCYALFYISTVFTLGHATQALGVPRQTMLGLQVGAITFMALGILISGRLADWLGRRPVLMAASALALAVGAGLAPALLSGQLLWLGVWMCCALLVMGLSFGPMGALLPELFPAGVRYTGASLAYNLGGILGASFAPWMAQWLVSTGGLPWVGAYVAMAGVISGSALWLMPETLHRTSA